MMSKDCPMQVFQYPCMNMIPCPMDQSSLVGMIAWNWWSTMGSSIDFSMASGSQVSWSEKVRNGFSGSIQGSSYSRIWGLGCCIDLLKILHFLLIKYSWRYKIPVNWIWVNEKIAHFVNCHCEAAHLNKRSWKKLDPRRNSRREWSQLAEYVK